jgi:hypothetical protein
MCISSLIALADLSWSRWAEKRLGGRTRWKTVPHLFALPLLFHNLLNDTSDLPDRGRLVTVFFDVGG